jgi:hypothetical protein
MGRTGRLCDLQGAGDTDAGANMCPSRRCGGGRGIIIRPFFDIGCMDVIVQRTSPLSHTSGILYIIIYVNTQL